VTRGVPIPINTAAITQTSNTFNNLIGYLRIYLCLRNIVLVQEETPDREVLVRIRPTREAAEEFVAHRLETYERMWDGCGCKVDYSER
jgi:hypothetical protein